MSAHLPPFAALRALDAIGRCGGIRRAADMLGVSHAVVSRHLRGLEDLVGATLFDREHGRLTAAGDGYHACVARALQEIEAATLAVGGAAAERLVISCASGLALHWLTGRLSDFARKPRAAAVELRSLDIMPDLAANVVDGDVRYLADGHQSSLPRGVMSIELARPAVFPVASPGLAERLSATSWSVDNLIHERLIEETSDDEWRRWLAAQDVVLPPGQHRARFGHAHLALAAARMGQGIALANHFIAGDDLTQGRLVRLRPARGKCAIVPLGAYTFVAHRSRWHSVPLVAFRNWLVGEFKRNADHSVL